MIYSLIRLRFDGLVHFGSSDSARSLFTSEDHFYADTLFSALCHAALSLHGEAGVQALIQQARDGTLLLSDSMPWKRTAQGIDYYLPKPCKSFVDAAHRQETATSSRKALKRLNWIAVSEFLSFFRPQSSRPFVLPKAETFGMPDGRAQTSMKGMENPMPYQVGTYRFLPDCGLYFLLGCRETVQCEQVAALLQALGISGIGGKTGVGFGRFAVEKIVTITRNGDEQTRWLHEALNAADASDQMLLTTSLPQERELEAAVKDAQYRLIRRGGFIQSDTFDDRPMKKQTQYYFAAGAVFPHRYQGDVYCAASDGRHPVMRYAKPMFLGVKA